MIDDEMQVIDTIDQSYWNGKFVPPPPRPPFLEESIAPDGLTTCDLCSWAWQDKGSLSLDGAIKEIFTSSDTKEFNWTFALIVVSLTSAFLGAIIMIVFLRCKRTNSGLWTWFSSRKNLSTPDQLVNSHTLPVENHYTHMDDNNYNPVQIDEASYAEVGNEIGPSETTSYKSGSVQHGTDNDILIMNCPLPAIPTGSHSASGGASGSGSAYYSGLLNNANMTRAEDEDERPYEIVDLKEMSSPHKNHNVQSHFLNETNNLLTIEKHSETLPEGTISASDYV
ncbi:AGAP004878-PA [Anopheles gambiae str. PEST]|uniref:AGAP004878-PA n=1 Tax=Anopheles gambiae TaxID=7165 RepID=A7UTD9_ANOGA|nr:AGAP004878-PA [Anopheles gambiae str. PEST]